MIEIDGPSWSTPLTAQPARRNGMARLTKTSYTPGYYRLEGVHGDEIFEVVNGNLPVTTLDRREKVGNVLRWKTWMVDDPLHWWGMGERVDEIGKGANVLCAGLGLGLMAHHLAARDDIESVTVVEIDKDVIDLITPTLPSDDRITVVNGDFYDVLADPETPEADAILWDLVVDDGTAADEARELFRFAKFACGLAMPNAQLLRFGERKTKRPLALEPR